MQRNLECTNPFSACSGFLVFPQTKPVAATETTCGTCCVRAAATMTVVNASSAVESGVDDRNCHQRWVQAVSTTIVDASSSLEVSSSNDRNCNECRRAQAAAAMATIVDGSSEAGSSVDDGNCDDGNCGECWARTATMTIVDVPSDAGSSDDRNCNKCRVRTGAETMMTVDRSSEVRSTSDDRNCDECRVRAAATMTIVDTSSEAGKNDNRDCDKCRVQAAVTMTATTIVGGSSLAEENECTIVPSERALPVVRVIQTGSMIFKESHILRQNYYSWKDQPRGIIRWEEAVPVNKAPGEGILLKLARSVSYNSSCSCKHDGGTLFDDYGFNLIPGARESVSFPTSPSHSLFDSTQGGTSSPSSSLSSSSSSTSTSFLDVEAQGGMAQSSEEAGLGIAPQYLMRLTESKKAPFVGEKMGMAAPSIKSKTGMLQASSMKSKMAIAPSMKAKIGMAPSRKFKTSAMVPSIKVKTRMSPWIKARTTMAPSIKLAKADATEPSIKAKTAGKKPSLKVKTLATSKGPSIFKAKTLAMAPSMKAKTAKALPIKVKTGMAPWIKAKTAMAPTKAAKTGMAPSMKAKTGMALTMKAKTAMAPSMKAKTSTKTKTGMGSKRRLHILLCFLMNRRERCPLNNKLRKKTTIGGFLSATWRALKKSLNFYRGLHRRKERRQIIY